MSIKISKACGGSIEASKCAIGLSNEFKTHTLI